jgi:hypothetical protein
MRRICSILAAATVLASLSACAKEPCPAPDTTINVIEPENGMVIENDCPGGISHDSNPCK